jgi:hypothetical protein
MRARLLVTLSGAVLTFAMPTAGVATPAAIFPMEFVDTSGEAPGPGREARLEMATGVLSQALAEKSIFAPVDLGAYGEEIAKMQPRYQCGDCFLDVARKAGAAYAVVSVVHKVSTLISSMDFAIFDVSTGVFVADLNGQIRGDDDEAYRHGVKFLVRNRLPDVFQARPGPPK